MRPWLDLIVPYAGSSSLLRQTVESVLSQDEGGWRLVVVEDGPQDAAVEPWLTGLADPRVEFRRNPHRLGVAGNFQRCLDLCQGSHVALVGCDDRLLPGYVRAVRQALERFPRASVVQPGVRVIDGEGRPARPLGDRVKSAVRPRGAPRLLGGQSLLTSLMIGNWTYFPSLCWRLTDVVAQGFRPDLETVLDLDLLCRIVLAGGRMALSEEVAFEYRRHRASASSIAAVRSERFTEERAVMHEITARCSDRSWTAAGRAARWRPTSRLHSILQINGALRRGDGTALRALARHAVGS